MTRQEAKELIASGREIDYLQVSYIFKAFDCDCRVPDGTTEVYFRKYTPCGMFTAHDEFGIGVLSPDQVYELVWMIACIEKWEQTKSQSQGP